MMSADVRDVLTPEQWARRMGRSELIDEIHNVVVHSKRDDFSALRHALWSEMQRRGLSI